MTPIEKLKAWYGNQNQDQIKVIAKSLAASTVLIGGLAWYSLGRDNYTLYLPTGDKRDVSEIVSILESDRIDYIVNSDGSVMINRKHVERANASLALNGVSDGATDGYGHLLSSQNAYTSAIKENLFQNQVIEEELAKLIMAIDGVQGVNVKLALSRESQFMRQQKPASASIVLTLRRGLVLTQNQVMGIVNLVSSAVPNLPQDNVTVLDQTGRILSQVGEGFTASNQHDARLLVESEVQQKLVGVIAPIVGIDNVRVSVSAVLNFDKVENTTERPLEEVVVLSEQKETTYDQSMSGGNGVPGALSNQPPNHAEFSDTPAGSASGQNDTPLSHERVVTNYVVGKSITHTKSATGNVDSLSVAILLNEQAFDEDFDIDALQVEINRLAEASIGFDADTDALSVSSLNFMLPTDAVAEPEQVDWIDHPMTMKALQLGQWLLVIMAIYLFLLRPVLNRAFPSMKEESDDKETKGTTETPDGEIETAFDFTNAVENQIVDEYEDLRKAGEHALLTEPAISLEALKVLFEERSDEFADTETEQQSEELPATEDEANKEEQEDGK